MKKKFRKVSNETGTHREKPQNADKTHPHTRPRNRAEETDRQAFRNRQTTTMQNFIGMKLKFGTDKTPIP
jgi:hypothetical protein